MSTSHLINANIHRAKEGARVLEDIARFLLCDETLLHKLREIRHSIQISEPIYAVTEDIGAYLIEDNVRNNPIEVIQANATRLQEALRVLEEFTVLAHNKSLVKKLRYQAYDIHAKLYYAARKYLKSHLLYGLYLIIDPDIIPLPLTKIIELINLSPVNIIQYRNKSAAKKIIADDAAKIKQQLAPGKLLIINDHIDVALDIGNGVHLGQDDYPLNRIRNIIPGDFILGISCHNLEAAQRATEFNPSYIAVGCLFNTASKSSVTSVSIQELQAICNQIAVPICAIGGINSNNLNQVLSADIKMAAVISYVWTTTNPLQTITAMHTKIFT